MSKSLPVCRKLFASLALLRLALIYGLLGFLLLEGLLLLRAIREVRPRPTDPSPPPHAPGMAVPFHGVTVALEQYPDSPARRQALARLRDAGFGWVRQRLDWRELEPAPGRIRWERVDPLLADIQEVGLEPVVVLDGSPVWARDPRDRPPTDNPLAPPADPGDFAAFAGQVATRYRERLRYYQIWDEPNIAPRWGNRWVDPVGYARLLQAAASAIRAADPDAVILTGALAPTADRGHAAVDEVYFLERLYAAGGASAFDVLAIQPFGFGHPPEDLPSRRAVLNFRRAQWIRRAMLAAGDADTPVWAVRYGWSRQPNPVWRAVSPEEQVAFTARAVALARAEWPWMAAMGWAIDRPAAPPHDPLWGFALVTPQGTETPLLQAWPREISQAAIGAGNPFSCPDCLWSSGWILAPWGLGAYFLGWTGALVLLLWRGQAAWGRLGQAFPRSPGRGSPSPRRGRTGLPDAGDLGLGLAWLILAGVYFLATWPPLIGLCWVLGGVLLWHRPRVGLYLLAVLLPFHYRWKDIRLVEGIWSLPPAHAVLLALVPACLRALWRSGTAGRDGGLRARGRGLTGADGLALAWLGVSLVTLPGAWYLPGYLQGMWDLVLAPGLMFAAVRSLARPTDRSGLAWALAVGGAAAAFLGLVDWIQGGGTWVDGVRRLSGLAFSPNQTALYLERTLFLWMAWLAFPRAAERRSPWMVSLALAGLAITGGALGLTASRGAWLLGVPVGAAVLLWGRMGFQASGRRTGWRGPVLLLGLLVLAGGLVVAPRLVQGSPVRQRIWVWQAALELWRSRPWTGVGPGGFFWSYPAFMLPAAAAEPNLQHPHNVWLELATGWGVGGLAWLLALGGWVLARARGSLDWVALGLLAGMAAGGAHGQVDAFLALPELAGWLWLALALLATERPGRDEEI